MLKNCYRETIESDTRDPYTTACDVSSETSCRLREIIVLYTAEHDNCMQSLLTQISEIGPKNTTIRQLKGRLSCVLILQCHKNQIKSSQCFIDIFREKFKSKISERLGKTIAKGLIVRRCVNSLMYHHL